MIIDESVTSSLTADRFQAILEQSPLSIQIMSADGRIIRVNRAWEELWGVTLDQLDGYSILNDEQLVKNGIMPYIRRAFDGHAAELPPVLYDPNITVPDITRHAEPKRWTKAIIYPIKNSSGAVQEVVLMHEDITTRVYAEDQLKLSEARYRMVFETTLDGIMVVDEQGQYIDVNESLCRILKTPREKLIGSHFSEYMISERLEEAQESFSVLRETGSFTGRFPMRAGDGSIVELEWKSRAHFMPGLHLCVARDVSERQNIEDALRVSESRYQLAAEAGRVGVWDLNLDGNELYLAPNLKAMLGYESNELANQFEAWSDLIHPEDKEKATAAAKSHLAGSAPRYEVEVRRRHRDGSYLWFLAQGIAIRDESGKPYRLTGSDTDITPRKKIEEELRQSEERNRSLLENANDIIYSHDLEGNYLSINRAGERITGYTREAVLSGMKISQIVVPEHLELARKMIEQKLSDPTPTVYEIGVFAKDGRRLTLEVSTRIAYQDARPVAVEGVARDVTERKQTQQEKMRFAEQIESQRKHLQAMVSSVPGVVWEAWGEPDAENQQIDFVSDYVETMLGYTVEEWVSTPNFWFQIVHPDDQEKAARNAAETFASRAKGTNQFRWIAKDGRVVWVEAQSIAICDDAGKPIGMRGVTMDISERKQKEANEKFFAEASAVLASSLDYETTLATVAGLAVPHFADWCSIDVPDETGHLNRLTVAHIDPDKVKWAHEIYQRYPADPDESHGLYNVMRTGQSEFYPDIPDELLIRGARDAGHLEILRQIGFRSCLMIPLKVRDRILGVLSFVNTEASRHHTPEDLALAENLAGRAALAVDNALLYRAEQQIREGAERTSDLLQRLQIVAKSLSQALTTQEVATAVIEQGLKSLGADAGNIVLLNDAGTDLEIIGAVNFSDEIIEKWQRFPLERRVPLTDAIRQKVPVLLESAENFQADYPELQPSSSNTLTQALAALPLTVEGRTIGALGLSFSRPQSFSEDDRAFMLALAQQCALALERAHLYETEQRLRSEAETASRLKDEFLATVSHELRTPLNAILGWATMLQHKNLDAPTSAKALATIERNARSQAQLIDDLLDVSRIITGNLRLEMRDVDPRLFIKAALEVVRPAAESKEITLQTMFDAAVGLISGDVSRLQQVIWNLLSNAVKFTPAGGVILVKLEQVDSEIEISVADTGEGIAPEFLPFVFDRFRQADGTSTRRHGGLGLGLAIVRQLVELHGGRVEVMSSGVGQGTTFTVKLPLVSVSHAHQIEQPNQQRQSNGEGNSSDQSTEPAGAKAAGGEATSVREELAEIMILVVDDETDSVELLEAVLSRRGAQVSIAASAKQALELIKQSPPDLLISDIGMPDEDGYQLIKQVRALSPAQGGRTPAIALTAYARTEDRLRALQAGFQMYIAKPVEMTELIAVVLSLINRSHV